MKKGIKGTQKPELLSDAELYAALSEELPIEALRPIPGTDRHSINDAYVHERLNKTFGVSGWTAKYEVISCRLLEDQQTWETSTKCTLSVPAYGILREQFGGCPHSDKGDSLKGAATDAFGKCCSQIGIGFEVYAGKVNMQEMPESDSYTKPVAGVQQSTKTKYVFHSGVIGDCNLEDWRWLRIGTILCHVGNDMPEKDRESVRDNLDYGDAEIAAHGFWEYAKRGRYLELTNLIHCRQLGPVEIPEMKEPRKSKASVEVAEAEPVEIRQ
jgi:hypothetical protein